METKFCQSCCMPMDKEELFGTEADGTRNEEYCCYCYQNGAFAQNCTMEEMAELCAGIMAEEDPNVSKETARAEMLKLLPRLKRWQTQ